MRSEESGASTYVPLDAQGSAFGRLSQEVVMRRGRMGEACLKAGLLTAVQVDEVVDLQNRHHIRFGEAAVQLGLLSDEQVRDVLAKQFNYANFEASGNSSKISQSLSIVHDPHSNDAEAIKRLRSEILQKRGERAVIAIAVLSPVAGEGKSHIAASLAISFAQLNVRTMLIDANLRNPVQHKLFSLTNKAGLSTILARRSQKSLDAVPEVMPTLWVMSAGPTPPNPTEIISEPRLAELITFFENDISVFIVDTPANSRWSDAQSLARQTGTALLVARENVTHLANLKKTKLDLTSLGVEVLGTVFNQPPKLGLGERVANSLSALSAWFRALFSKQGKDRF